MSITQPWQGVGQVSFPSSGSASDVPSRDHYTARQVVSYMSGMTWSRRGHHCGKTWPPKDLSTLVSAPNSHHTGDSNSCPPDLELGALTKWLASRILVWVSWQASLQFFPALSVFCKYIFTMEHYENIRVSLLRRSVEKYTAPITLKKKLRFSSLPKKKWIDYLIWWTRIVYLNGFSTVPSVLTLGRGNGKFTCTSFFYLWFETGLFYPGKVATWELQLIAFPSFLRMEFI